MNNTEDNMKSLANIINRKHILNKPVHRPVQKALAKNIAKSNAIKSMAHREKAVSMAEQSKKVKEVIRILKAIVNRLP